MSRPVLKPLRAQLLGGVSAIAIIATMGVRLS